MATRDITQDMGTADGARAERTVVHSAPVVRHKETKSSLLTTEFYAFVAAVAAILYAAWKAHNFYAPRAWTLIAAVTIGYMVCRGLAKSGSANRDRDDRD
jgi:hypothetical protein